MARPGIDFAESFVRQSARNAADELADCVRVTRDETEDRYVITCRNRTAHVQPREEHAQFARDLEAAVETVMGLRPPKGGA